MAKLAKEILLLKVWCFPQAASISIYKLSILEKRMFRHSKYVRREYSTHTKDESRLSSVSFTKWWPIIRSPPSRWQTLPCWVIGWSNLRIDWTSFFWTLNQAAKQAQTLFCIGRGKISHRRGVASKKRGSIENNINGRWASIVEIIG